MAKQWLEGRFSLPLQQSPPLACSEDHSSSFSPPRPSVTESLGHPVPKLSAHSRLLRPCPHLAAAQLCMLDRPHGKKGPHSFPRPTGSCPLSPQGHSMQEQNHDPRVLHRPWCPEHSQSERCCLRCLFCQCTAVMHELEDVAGPCTGCGAGRARRQLFDNAPWAEEDKDSCKFRKAWINSSPFPAAREPSSRAFPQPTHGHGLTSSLRKNSPPWLGDSHTAKATSSDTT